MRPLRAGTGLFADIRAGELRELHAEQRACRSARLTRIEILLDDLTGRAARKRIAVRRKIRGCQGLGDGGGFRRQYLDALQSTDGTAPAIDREGGACRAGRLENA